MAQSGKKSKKVPLKPIIVNSGYNSDCESSDCESSGSEAPTSPRSPRKLGKKVSFADHRGLALATVKLVKESPDEPPTFSSDLISSITKGAIADVTVKPPIKITFTQPASDYMAFRDKLNRNMVCLENVILRDYTVEGTIKVKNISFEKRVFVRLSLDGWLSFEDTEAKYVPGPGTTSHYPDPYDTFTFSLEVSPSFDTTQKVQFAVCFESNGKQYWDNCSGLNYVIVSDNYVERESGSEKFNMRFLPSKRRTESWSEFCAWKGDEDSPYY